MRTTHTQKLEKPLYKGDYVVATKYNDGDPMDPHCVGFFDEMTPWGKFRVVDSKGTQYYFGGFKKCERITAKTGAILCQLFKVVSDQRGNSIWYWRRNLKKAQKLLEVMEK